MLTCAQNSGELGGIITLYYTLPSGRWFVNMVVSVKDATMFPLCRNDSFAGVTGWR